MKDEVMAELQFIRRELEKISGRLRPTARCLPPAGAAKSLGVGLTKMRELIASGAVKTVLVGKRKMVTLTEIERVTAASHGQARRASGRASMPLQDPVALRAAIRRR